MEAWLNRGAGFASKIKSQGLKRDSRRKIYGSETNSGSHDAPKHFHQKNKKCDWKRDEFLSSFSLKKPEVPSRETYQDIDWSDSSSDTDKDEKLKIKSEPSDEKLNQENNSCLIERKIHLCKRKFGKFEVEKNLTEKAFSKKLMFDSSSKHGVNEIFREKRCKKTETSLSNVTEKSPIDKSHKMQSKLSNEKDKLKWTCSSFDVPFVSMPHQKAIRENKRKCAREISSQEISYDEERTEESLQPDIEDCFSSSSAEDDFEDIISDDEGDNGDDKKVSVEKIDEPVGREMTSSVYSQRSNDNLHRQFNEPSFKTVLKLSVSDAEMTSQLHLTPEAHNIRMSDSPLRDGSQLQISGASTPESNKSSQKMGASDWASLFQHQTSPPRDNHLVPGTEDSGKKKQKFASNSLTGQLARLISREKSSLRFWYHSLSAGTVHKNSSKCVVVTIDSISRQFSFMVCKCHILQGHLDKSSPCKVMLSRKLVDKFHLKPGMNLKICPPWQQMDDGNIVTLLCTNYVEVLKQNDSVTDDQEHSLSISGIDMEASPPPSCLSVEEHGHRSSGRPLHLVWTCPCSRDEALETTECPALQDDFNPKAHIHSASHALPPLFNLRSITSSTPPSSSSHHGHQRTLLESIEMSHQNGDCLPPFYAYILRVFRVNNDNENGFLLLLEDLSGTLAIVSLSEHEDVCGASLEHFTFVDLMKKEARICLCQGLSVQTRLNKEKDSQLFSVISQCWLQRKPALSSQESQEQESQCLQPSSSSLPRFEVADEQEQALKIELTMLAQVSKEGVSDRFSSLVQVMDLGNKSQGPLLIFDTQTSTKYLAFHRLAISEDCVTICRKENEPKLSAMLLRDVIMKDGMVHCDKYSSVICKSVWKSLGLEAKLDEVAVEASRTRSLRLPPLSCHAWPCDVGSVEGSIVSIDEDSSYSCEACVLCDAEITESLDTNARMRCPSCHQRVRRTTSKMRMTVMLRSEEFPTHVSVKLSLNEATIQSVLPHEKDKEGYDIEQVLGKKVKASVCFVKNSSPDLITLEQLEI